MRKVFYASRERLNTVLGGGTQFFVTRRMVDRFTTGLKNATRKVRNLILL